MYKESELEMTMKDRFKKFLGLTPKPVRDPMMSKYLSGPVRAVDPEEDEVTQIPEDVDLDADVAEIIDVEDPVEETVTMTQYSKEEIAKTLAFISEQIGVPNITKDDADDLKVRAEDHFEALRREISENVYSEVTSYLFRQELKDNGTLLDVLEAAKKYGEGLYEYITDIDLSSLKKILESRLVPAKLAYLEVA